MEGSEKDKSINLNLEEFIRLKFQIENLEKENKEIRSMVREVENRSSNSEKALLEFKNEKLFLILKEKYQMFSRSSFWGGLFAFFAVLSAAGLLGLKEVRENFKMAMDEWGKEVGIEQIEMTSKKIERYSVEGAAILENARYCHAELEDYVVKFESQVEYFEKNDLISSAEGNSLHIVSGSENSWQEYRDNGLMIAIDLKPYNFAETPYIFTSLGGKNHHWTSQGVTSVYKADNAGFFVFIHLPPKIAVKVKKDGQFLIENDWRLNWMAVGRTKIDM